MNPNFKRKNPKDIVHVHETLKNFDKNLRFTTDSNDGIALFKKPSNAGQYVNCSSNAPLVFQISWIKSFATRAKNLFTYLLKR